MMIEMPWQFLPSSLSTRPEPFLDLVLNLAVVGGNHTSNPNRSDNRLVFRLFRMSATGTRLVKALIPHKTALHNPIFLTKLRIRCLAPIVRSVVGVHPFTSVPGHSDYAVGADVAAVLIDPAGTGRVEAQVRTAGFFHVAPGPQALTPGGGIPGRRLFPLFFRWKSSPERASKGG